MVADFSSEILLKMGYSQVFTGELSDMSEFLIFRILLKQMTQYI